MAGFCRNCGSPLDDVQAFCARCGTAAGGLPVRSSVAPRTTPPNVLPAPRPPAASQPRPTAQASVPTPQAAAARSSKPGSTLVKVLLVFLVVIFLFGAMGIAGAWYVAHRVKQKVHEIGLDDLSTSTDRAPALGGMDPCSLLSKADVGQAAKLEIVRAQPAEGGDPGCTYNVRGVISDLVATHASLLHKEATTEAQRQQFESVAKNLFQGMDTEQTTSTSKYPGEAPVFAFSASNSGALAQMSLSRTAFSRMGAGVVTIPGLGDDALDIGGAMMLVRKGNKIVRIMYMMCPCTTDDVVPLVRTLTASM